MKTIALFLVLGSVLSACTAGPSVPASITHGPLTGAVTDTTATIWVRVTFAPSKVTLTPGGIQATFTSSQDNTYKAGLAGLTPNTSYAYSIYQGDTQLGGGQFKTFPSPGAEDNIRFLVLSDFFQNEETTVFQNAVADGPYDFVIIGGDFWHGNCLTPEMAASEFIDCQRFRFQDLFARTSGGWAPFHEEILSDHALIHFWDDHDQGGNNTDKTFIYKEEALQVLLEYFPTYPTSPYGDWQIFTHGQADFFILDSRSQRDPEGKHNSANRSMLDGDNLGAEGQLEWLKENLLTSAARWKFVVSPVTFNRTVNKAGAWRGYRNEHHTLVAFVEDNAIGGVIFITGDLHAGGMDDGTNSGLPEMLVPGIGPNFVISEAHPTFCGSVPSQDIGVWSHGFYGEGLETCPGYAIVEVSAISVVLTVYDGAGNVKLTMTVD